MLPVPLFRLRHAGLLLCPVLAFSTGVRANDSTAVLGSGGLVLGRTADISMDREDLYISPTEVRVDYLFTNTSDKPIETIVAFPMPDIEGYQESDVGVADRQSDNFMDFKVEQDGAPIETALQQRVIAGGLDVTEELDAQHVPKFPMSDASQAAVKALPAEVAADWLARGLITEDVYDAGQGEVHEFRANWTLRTTYWWRTVFPSKQPVRVHHTYRPSVGGTAALSFMLDGKPDGNYDLYKTRYCLNDGFMKITSRLQQAEDPDKGIFTFERWLSYILTTGGNWAGPIGTFHLTVDKGDPEAYVSFCGDGVKKTGPTTFEMTATDFVPQRDLDILILEHSPARMP